MADLTHADLVRAAARWLRGTRRCRVVMTERMSTSWESPDAIGWLGESGRSVLVECKTSRADFLADRKKPQRQLWTLGMGQERWFLTPPGLVKPADLPERWGLLETTGPRVRVVVKAEESKAVDHQIFYQEAPLLIAELARMQDEGIGLVMAAVRRLPKGDLMAVREAAEARLSGWRESAPVTAEDGEA